MPRIVRALAPLFAVVAVLFVVPSPVATAGTLKATFYSSYLNDANGDGTYSTPENTPFAGSGIPFQISLYNAGSTSQTITQLTTDDQGTPAACQSLIGTALRPGRAVSCAWTATGYAGAFGTSKISTATVTLGGQTFTRTSTVNTRNTIGVTLTNDANGDTVFSPDETATAAGESVPFQLAVTAVDYDYTINSVTLNGASVCSVGRKGTLLAAGTTMTCSFSASAPGAGTTATYTVVVSETSTTPGPSIGSYSIGTSTVTSP